MYTAVYKISFSRECVRIIGSRYILFIMDIIWPGIEVYYTQKPVRYTATGRVGVRSTAGARRMPEGERETGPVRIE